MLGRFKNLYRSVVQIYIYMERCVVQIHIPAYCRLLNWSEMTNTHR